MQREAGRYGSAPVDNTRIPAPPSSAIEPPALLRSRFASALAPWPWSAMMLRGGLFALLLHWGAARMVPPTARPAVSLAIWSGLSLLISMRWAAALPEQLRRSRAALSAGRSRFDHPASR